MALSMDIVTLHVISGMFFNSAIVRDNEVAISKMENTKGVG